MDDYIKPCSNFTCLGHQLTYKLRDVFSFVNFMVLSKTVKVSPEMLLLDEYLSELVDNM